MNGIICPKCDLLNLTTAENCLRCGSSLTYIPNTEYVSVPIEEIRQAQNFAQTDFIPQDNEIGRKTFFWYRIYCSVLLVLYLAVTIFGFAIVLFQPESNTSDKAEMLITGVVYGVIGAVFSVLTAIALFLPRKPWNWIVGIVMIAFGMTSCCFIPAVVPLMIFWVKPETKAFFGRK